MLRHFIIAAAVLAAQLAQASEAGRVIFVAGQVQAAGKAVRLGDAVPEGDLLHTGADGYLYVKTIDDGLFILRPNTDARIATYQVDTADPSNTHVKLELLKGTARSQSGKAVKLARQNFRFNTPVAAIGVRGTDFTVFTDQNTTRVVVMSGGITVSGFGGGCRPEGTGPCEGVASKELSAAQKGQLLQIQRGAAPQVMPGSALSPDVATPPRQDEPAVKASAANTTSTAGTPTILAASEPSLDAQKSVTIQQHIAAGQAAIDQPPVVTTPPVETVSPPVVTPPVVTPPVVVAPPVVVPPPVVVAPVVPDRTIIWGRWQPVLDQAAKVNLVAALGSGAEVVSVMGDFALLRSAGQDFVTPQQGSASFALKQGEAYIYNPLSLTPVIAATLQNGQLQFNFDKATFATSIDLVSQAETFNLQSKGIVVANGHFAGVNLYSPTANITLEGQLSTENGGSAAYIFQGKLDANRTVSGATYWGK